MEEIWILLSPIRARNLKKKALYVPEAMRECVNLSEEEAKVLYNLTYKVLNNIERKEAQ